MVDKMLVKCGREEFELGETDLIMHNGACFQIVTKKTWVGWNCHNPIITNNKAKKMIKDGSLIEANRKDGCVYYKVSK